MTYIGMYLVVDRDLSEGSLCKLPNKPIIYRGKDEAKHLRLF